jgi:hypothetical protein
VTEVEMEEKVMTATSEEGKESAEAVMVTVAEDLEVEDSEAAKAAAAAGSAAAAATTAEATEEAATVEQGLTLVHFPAQRKRFLRDKGCI